jgi:cell wall-associated NlpC family hydrolase
MMTPYQFAQLYWHLSVPIVNQNNEIVRWEEQIRVSKYRLAERLKQETEAYDAPTTAFLAEFGGKFTPFNNTTKDDKTEEIKVFVKKTDGAIEAKTYKPAEKWKLYGVATRAIWGKGSPEDVQITLQLAVRFGLIAADRIQEYCDAGKVGLDCNGFVGRYMQTVLGKKTTANSLIDHLMMQGRPITKLEEIDDVSIYILGYVDGAGKVIAQYSGGEIGHVMITNPFHRGGMKTELIGQHTDKKFYRRLTVVESTGGKGLVESDYLILDHKTNGVFTVFRGSQQRTMPVRITRVWI